MHEILFKAKRLDNGEWVEGICSEIENKKNSTVDTFIIKNMCVKNGKFFGLIFKVDPKTICEVSGI